MKRFTVEDERRRFGIETDEQGYLYLPQMRALMRDHVSAEALPAVEAFSALGYAARMVHLQMERWAERHGLSEMRLRILFMLRHMRDGVPLGVLATKLYVSARNVTGLVDHLERDGLVVRVPDPADRRSVLARLTERGEERIDAVWEESVVHQRGLLTGFAPEDLARLRHLCLSLVAKMEGDIVHNGKD